ncbi:MORN repeat-containing protein [Babesia ovis]|uniref:MORN repeat-containing protein n=1 Tax=Babesia ovis TaxID=5869 RepID=A0A9W5TC14_BABOV|nr:MORN repeat-containing protein [Babesia ovis]
MCSISVELCDAVARIVPYRFTGGQNVSASTTTGVKNTAETSPEKEGTKMASCVPELVHTGFKEMNCGEWDDKVLATLLGGQPTNIEDIVAVESGNGLVERGPVVLQDGSVYCGQWQGTERHGLGKHFAIDGTRYKGSFANNKYDGVGDIRYVNGDVFKGHFKDGLRNGKGVMWYSNGDMFDGSWCDGARHGFGVERFADGSVYMGMFKDNKREGSGELKLSDGVIYEGTFDNDVTGHGKMVWPNGETYTGELKHGFKHNYGITKYRNGPVFSEKGKYNMGRMDGLFERVMRGGQKCIYLYKNGEFVKDVTNSKEAVKQIQSLPVAEIPTTGLVLVDEANDGKQM